MLMSCSMLMLRSIYVSMMSVIVVVVVWLPSMLVILLQSHYRDLENYDDYHSHATWEEQEQERSQTEEEPYSNGSHSYYHFHFHFHSHLFVHCSHLLLLL